MNRSGESRHGFRTRRHLLRALATGAVFGAPALRSFAADTYVLPFGNGERPLAKFPQKRPLIVLTSRPPQLETPWKIYNEGVVTPNDAFFVRYHLAGIPTNIEPSSYRITVKGKVATPLTLSLAELRTMDAIEVLRRQPMLGQQSRILRAARGGRAARERRNGECEAGAACR